MQFGRGAWVIVFLLPMLAPVHGQGQEAVETTATERDSGRSRALIRGVGPENLNSRETPANRAQEEGRREHSTTQETPVAPDPRRSVTLPGEQPAPEAVFGVPEAERPGLGGEPFIAREPVTPPVPGAGPYWLNSLVGLDDSPVKLYGWIENSFTGNTNGRPPSGTNFALFPNHLANQWMGNQYYLIAEKALEDIDRINIGFRVDAMFGNDWVPLHSHGLFDYAWPFPPGDFRGFDLPQMYARVHLPWFTEGGLDIKGGRFYSIADYEAIPVVSRPLLSLPYVSTFTPFTFFGALTTLHLTDRINLYNGAVNGPDRWINQNYRWSYFGGVGWTSRDLKTTLNFTILTGGPNQFPNFPRIQPLPLPAGTFTTPALQLKRNLSYDRNLLNYIDAILIHQWNERLTQVGQTFLFAEQAVPGPAPGDPTHDQEWYGFAHWFLYDLRENLTAVWRAEIFRDDDGGATGVADTYYEMTLGLRYKPKPWVWIRPEARYDWAQFHAPFNDGTRSSRFTIGFDVVVLF